MGVFVVIVVGIVNVHTVLRHTRRRALEAPVVIVVIREIGRKVIGPEVAAIVAIKFVTIMIGVEFIRSGIIYCNEKLIAAVIMVTMNIELTGDSPVVVRTGDIKMDMGLLTPVATGVDLFVFGLLTVVIRCS